jgi:hypothetical protein
MPAHLTVSLRFSPASVQLVAKLLAALTAAKNSLDAALLDEAESVRSTSAIRVLT